MVVKIRLVRFGRKHQPVYNIVVAHARTARGSKPMEVLGTYDPIPRKIPYSPPGSKKVKDIQLDMSRARYWLGVGAQPSEPAWRLMSMLGLLEPRYANGKYNGKPTIIDEPQIVDQIWNNYNDMLDEGNQNHKQWEEAQEEGQTASTKNEEASATKSL